MREIEFRGKRKFDNTWIYGGYMKTARTNKIQIGGTSRFCTVYPETLGQYTGLIDKNGTKIFEGDIIKGITEDTNQARYGVIKYGKYKDENFEDSCLGIYFEFEGKQFSIFNGEAQGYYLPSLIEVVGNIYDNPELLEG